MEVITAAVKMESFMAPNDIQWLIGFKRRLQERNTRQGKLSSEGLTKGLSVFMRLASRSIIVSVRYDTIPDRLHDVR